MGCVYGSWPHFVLIIDCRMASSLMACGWMALAGTWQQPPCKRASQASCTRPYPSFTSLRWVHWKTYFTAACRTGQRADIERSSIQAHSAQPSVAHKRTHTARTAQHRLAYTKDCKLPFCFTAALVHDCVRNLRGGCGTEGCPLPFSRATQHTGTSTQRSMGQHGRCRHTHRLHAKP